MQSLPFALPEPGQAQLCFPSHQRSANSPSLLGRILSGRYKISNIIDVATFKGHDLVLDQAVIVREVSAPQEERHIWRQKARLLALAQNPNFFNVIDSVCDESRDFVVSERPRGRSVAEWLSEGRPVCPDEVPDLIRPLASALDSTAVARVCSTFVSASSTYAELKRTFAFRSRERSHRESPRSNEPPSFLLKLDVWELANPRNRNSPVILMSKARERSRKRLVVRQTALFAYELLGGVTQGSFKPLKQLGKAGNAVLYRGLRGSFFIKNAKSFLHKLELAIQSDARQLRTQAAVPAEIP